MYRIECPIAYRVKCPTCGEHKVITKQEAADTWPEVKLVPDDNGGQDFPD